MSLTVRPLLCFISAVLVANTVLAKSANTTSSATSSQAGNTANTGTSATPALSAQKPQSPQNETQVSGLLNVSKSTSLYDFQDGSRKDGLDYEARLIIKFNDKYSLNFIGGYSQDLKNPEGNDFSDTAVSISRSPLSLGKTLLVGYGIGSVLPTAKDTYKNKGLLGSIGPSLSLTVNPDRLITGLSISTAISFGRNFHEYETALDGKVNTQYSSKQSLSLEYAFGSGFAISGLFIHRNTWSYQNVMRDSYEASEEVGYQFTPHFAVALGHTNSGSTLKPNGTESNVQLVGENTSLVYASTTLAF